MMPPTLPASSAGGRDAALALTAAPGDPEAEASAADRVVVFSDAVVAIAITLLALALPVPDTTSATTNGQLLHMLRANGDQYFAFLLSFVIIGNNWSAHRRTFRYVNRLNSKLVTLNMIWLLIMVLTPYTARLLAAQGAFGLRFGSYALTQVIASACLLLMNRQISHANLLRTSAPAAAGHPDNSHYLALIVTFLISIPMAFATVWAFALWISVPVLSPVLRRLLASRRHATDDRARTA
jgi:uncharacterized membrane protein